MSDPAETNPYQPPVAALLQLGDVRGQKEWPDYGAHGFTDEHIPELLRLSADKALYYDEGEGPEGWAPIHAWRVLGLLRAEAAIPPLLDLMEKWDESDWMAEELPSVFGRIGAPALRPLEHYLRFKSSELSPRINAVTGIKEIALQHPELREAGVAALTGLLEDFAANNDEYNGFIVGALMDLEAVESAPVIERAFAAGAVDPWIAGDWEEVQVEFGLLPERLTPRPKYPLLRYGSGAHGQGGTSVPKVGKAKSKKKHKQKIAKAARRRNRRK